MSRGVGGVHVIDDKTRTPRCVRARKKNETRPHGAPSAPGEYPGGARVATSAMYAVRSGRWLHMVRGPKRACDGGDDGHCECRPQ